MKNTPIYLLMVAVFCAVGCNKYLDVEPKGYTLLQSTTDYDKWLNASALATDQSAQNIRLMSDCVDAPLIAPGTTASNDLVYLWAPQFTLNLSDAIPFWSDIYQQIYYYNTLINGIGEATGGSEQQKASLKAEALLGRAYCYFNLINLYGKAYDPATADQDLAVPFVTSNDVSAVVPPRSTVNQLYKQIVDDIQTALPDLPASNARNHFRGSVASAYSVLARIYFYRMDYAKAAQNASLALTQDASIKMLDYNTYNTTVPTPLPNQGISSDAIYSRNLASIGGLSGSDATPAVEFLRSFDSTDLRLRFFYFTVRNNLKETSFDYTYSTSMRGAALYTGSAAITSSNYYYTHNSGTTVAEMKLILAEEAARREDLSTALGQLNDVRKCRRPTATYVAFSTTDANVALQEILLERNRELALNGPLRWYDMRRLDKEGRMPELKRYNSGNSVIATLPQHGDRYTLQIPNRVLSYNSGMPQNP